jgi:hypothetical protein
MKYIRGFHNFIRDTEAAPSFSSFMEVDANPWGIIYRYKNSVRRRQGI